MPSASDGETIGTSDSAQAGNVASSDIDINSALIGNVAQVRVIGSALSSVESTGNKAYSDLVKSLNIEDDAPTGDSAVSKEPRVERRAGNDAYSELVKSLNIQFGDDATPERQESGNVASLSTMIAPPGNIALSYIPAGIINVQQIARPGNVALPNIYYKSINPAYLSNPAPAAKKAKGNDEPCRVDVIFVESKPLPKEPNIVNAPEIVNAPKRKAKPNATSGKDAAEKAANDVKQTHVAPTDNAAQTKTASTESETNPSPNKLRKTDYTIDNEIKDSAEIEDDTKTNKTNMKKLTTVKLKSGITFTTFKPVNIASNKFKKFAFAQKSIKRDEKEKNKVIITKLGKVESSKTVAEAVHALKRKQGSDLSKLHANAIIIVDSPEMDVEAKTDSLEPTGALADKPKMSSELAKLLLEDLKEESKSKSISDETPHVLKEINSKTVLQESTQNISDFKGLPLDSTVSTSAAMSRTSHGSTKAAWSGSSSTNTFPTVDMANFNTSDAFESSTESKSILLRDKMLDSWSDSAMVAADLPDISTLLSPKLWTVTTDFQDFVGMSPLGLRDSLANVSPESIETSESRAKSSEISKSQSISIGSSSELSPSSVSESILNNNTQDSKDLPDRLAPGCVNVELPQFDPNYVAIEPSSPRELPQDQQTPTNTNVKSLRAATLSVISESSSDMLKSSVKSTADSASMVSSSESTSNVIKLLCKSPSGPTSTASSPKTPTKSSSNPVSPASLPQLPSEKPESRSEKPELPSDIPESPSVNPESPSNKPVSPELARQHSEASREPSEPDQMTMELGIRRGDSSMPVLVF